MKKVVIFAPHPLAHRAYKLVKAVGQQPTVQVAGVVLVENRREAPERAPRDSQGATLGERARRAGRWLPAAILQQGRRLVEAWHDLFVPVGHANRYVLYLEEGRIPLFRLAAINAPDCGVLLDRLDPDVGIAFGVPGFRKPALQPLRLGLLRIANGDVVRTAGAEATEAGGKHDGHGWLTLPIRHTRPGSDAEGDGEIVEVGRLPVERFDNERSLALKSEMLGVRHGVRALRKLIGAAPVPESPDTGVSDAGVPSSEGARGPFRRSTARHMRRELQRSGPQGIRRLAATAFRIFRAGYFFLGLPAWALWRRRLEHAGNAPVVIFYYHAASNTIENWMTVPLEILRAHVEYASKYFDVISIEEAVTRLRSGGNSRAAVVFTFDDGYKSCRTFVQELFEYYEIPACFFVCASACEQRLSLPHDIDKGYRHAALMNMDDLKALAAAGFEIGSHGLLHENMAALTRSQAETVLRESRAILERSLGRPVRYFSFPYGDPDSMSPAVLRQASAHYEASFSAYGGYNLPDGARFQYQRIANPFDVSSFKAICNGVHRFRPYYVRHLHEPQ